MTAAAATSNNNKSLWSRPLDLIYFVYFATHIPITLLVDLQSVYPPKYVPQALKDLNQWYLTTYKDPFMTNASNLPWFKSFGFCELFVQTPLFFAACHGLYKNSDSIRLPLIVYGAHVATTLVPVFAELFFNPEYAFLTTTELATLCAFYLPYLIIPLTILVDSYCRVSARLNCGHAKTE